MPDKSFLTFYFRGGDDSCTILSSNSGADGGDSRNDTCLFASKVLHETAIGAELLAGCFHCCLAHVSFAAVSVIALMIL